MHTFVSPYPVHGYLITTCLIVDVGYIAYRLLLYFMLSALSRRQNMICQQSVYVTRRAFSARQRATLLTLYAYLGLCHGMCFWIGRSSTCLHNKPRGYNERAVVITIMFSILLACRNVVGRPGLRGYSYFQLKSLFLWKACQMHYFCQRIH